MLERVFNRAPIKHYSGKRGINCLSDLTSTEANSVAVQFSEQLGLDKEKVIQWLQTQAITKQQNAPNIKTASKKQRKQIADEVLKMFTTQT